MQKKTAQATKRRHKARRLLNNLGGGALAQRAPFRKVISDMDRTDKKVRKEAEDLNYFIGMSKSFVRRKDYLTAATYLGKFHEKAALIHFNLNEFKSSIPESEQRKFILKNFKGKEKTHFMNYDPEKDHKIKPAANNVEDGLVATAGAMKDWWRTPGRFKDLLVNLTDRRSREMRAMEKNFSIPFYQQLVTDTEEMLNITQSFFEGVLENFHNMGSAWSRRDVGAYVIEIQGMKGEGGFNNAYNEYHKKYLEFHKTNVLPMRAEQEKIDRETDILDKARKDAQPAPTLEMPEVPSLPSQKLPEGSPTPQAQDTATESPPSSGTRTIQPPAFDGPITQRVPEVTLAPVRPRPPGATTVQYIDNQVDTKRFPNRDIPQKEEDVPFSFNGTPKQNVDDLMDGHQPFNLTQRKVKSHEDFLNRIEKLSTDHEIIREILTYSEEVEKYSEEESLKLLAVAEGLIEKQAAGDKKKTKTKAKVPEKTPEEPEVKSFIPKSDPETEPMPNTQRSVPSDTDAGPGPGTRRMPENIPNGPPASLEGPKDTFDKVYHDKFKPVEHNIPLGIVGKRWHEIPFLRDKSMNDVRISSNTADVLWGILVKKLDAYYLPYNSETLRPKLVKEIIQSLKNGKVETNMQCSGSRDCELQVFSYIQLDKIESDPSFEGQILTFIATLRLTRFEGKIIIRTITNVKFHDGSK